MAGVDGDGFLRALRARLREPGPDGRPRSSWGRPQLLEVLDELEAAHTPDESSDAAVLRRFAGALTDTLLEVLPDPTPGPLTDDDRETSPAMDGGGAIRSLQGGTHDHDRHAGLRARRTQAAVEA